MVTPVKEEDPIRKIRVLFPIHQGMDSLDFVGPYEMLSHAYHDPSEKSIYHSLRSHHIQQSHHHH